MSEWDGYQDFDDEDLTPRPGDAYCDYCEREGHTFSACPRRDTE